MGPIGSFELIKIFLRILITIRKKFMKVKNTYLLHLNHLNYRSLNPSIETHYEGSAGEISIDIPLHCIGPRGAINVILVFMVIAQCAPPAYDVARLSNFDPNGMISGVNKVV